MFRSATLGAIGAYQRHISPYKGYCCAYRHHTGRCSCSEYARRIVLRCGPLALIKALPRQLARCRVAYAAILAAGAAGTTNTNNQDDKKKFSDACDCVPDVCDIASCDAIPCDCSW